MVSTDLFSFLRSHDVVQVSNVIQWVRVMVTIPHMMPMQQRMTCLISFEDTGTKKTMFLESVRMLLHSILLQNSSQYTSTQLHLGPCLSRYQQRSLSPYWHLLFMTGTSTVKRKSLKIKPRRLQQLLTQYFRKKFRNG